MYVTECLSVHSRIFQQQRLIPLITNEDMIYVIVIFTKSINILWCMDFDIPISCNFCHYFVKNVSVFVYGGGVGWGGGGGGG